MGVLLRLAGRSLEELRHSGGAQCGEERSQLTPRQLYWVPPGRLSQEVFQAWEEAPGKIKDSLEWQCHKQQIDGTIQITFTNFPTAKNDEINKKKFVFIQNLNYFHKISLCYFDKLMTCGAMERMWCLFQLHMGREGGTPTVFSSSQGPICFPWTGYGYW